MTPFVKRVLFGIGVFSVFMIIALLLKYVAAGYKLDGSITDLITETDLMLGVLVAVFVTVAHIRRTKLK